MTPEQQRIVIAEACGWKWEYFPDMGDGGSYGWVKNGCFPRNANPPPFPDYLNDLNAMHEAESEVLFRQRLAQNKKMLMSEYIKQLALVCEDAPSGYFADSGQRAEAFLRTIGKWKP